MRKQRPAVKTTGVFGGSFDPIHKGHTSLARHVIESGLCDEVWLMVSPLNPLKAERPPVGFADRLAMARLATESIEGVTASDFEAGLPLPSYTYRTLTAMSEKWPDRRFRLIIGADNWTAFSRWRNPEEIVRDYHPIVYPRPGVEISPETLPAEVSYLEDAPLTDISSTELRRELADPHLPPSPLMDERVRGYALSHHLYD